MLHFESLQKSSAYILWWLTSGLQAPSHNYQLSDYESSICVKVSIVWKCMWFQSCGVIPQKIIEVLLCAVRALLVSEPLAVMTRAV